MTTGQLLRRARLRAGLSPAQLARRYCRPRSQIARWEQGRVEPGFDTLCLLLRACGFDISETLVRVRARRPETQSRD
jgi:transcriptional regulator with XRE-family HTH domain